jgi:hypothetical protein
MPHRIFKSLLLAGIIITTSSSISSAAFAASVSRDYAKACAELEDSSTTWTNAPSPMAILCPVVRTLNVLVLSAGAIFVIFVFISAIKYALSQGDPKALQASQQTLTTAVIGFIVVIGVYTLLTIIKNVLGLKDNPITDPFGTLSENLARLFEKFGISTK